MFGRVVGGFGRVVGGRVAAEACGPCGAFGRVVCGRIGGRLGGGRVGDEPEALGPRGALLGLLLGVRSGKVLAEFGAGIGYRGGGLVGGSGVGGRVGGRRCVDARDGGGGRGRLVGGGCGVRGRSGGVCRRGLSGLVVVPVDFVFGGFWRWGRRRSAARRAKGHGRKRDGR